jgi:hypothetical protein
VSEERAEQYLPPLRLSLAELRESLAPLGAPSLVRRDGEETDLEHLSPPAERLEIVYPHLSLALTCSSAYLSFEDFEKSALAALSALVRARSIKRTRNGAQLLFTAKPKQLTLAKLGLALKEMGPQASLHFVEDGESRIARLEAPKISLDVGESAVRCRVDFEVEELYERLWSHRSRRALFTHEDPTIFVGMLLPAAAALASPPSHRLLAAGIAGGVWLLYALWASHNADHHWITFKDS